MKEIVTAAVDAAATRCRTKGTKPRIPANASAMAFFTSSRNWPPRVRSRKKLPQ